MWSARVDRGGVRGTSGRVRCDPAAAIADGMRDAAREIAPAMAEAAVEEDVAPQAAEAQLCAAVSAAEWTSRDS